MLLNALMSQATLSDTFEDVRKSVDSASSRIGLSEELSMAPAIQMRDKDGDWDQLMPKKRIIVSIDVCTVLK